jgi:hypothetical protein
MMAVFLQSASDDREGLGDRACDLALDLRSPWMRRALLGLPAGR